ncbi:C2 domain-containing protein, partial [Haematococcus lacustris]
VLPGSGPAPLWRTALPHLQLSDPQLDLHLRVRQASEERGLAPGSRDTVLAAGGIRLQGLQSGVTQVMEVPLFSRKQNSSGKSSGAQVGTSGAPGLADNRQPCLQAPLLESLAALGKAILPFYSTSCLGFRAASVRLVVQPQELPPCTSPATFNPHSLAKQLAAHLARAHQAGLLPGRSDSLPTHPLAQLPLPGLKPAASGSAGKDEVDGLKGCMGLFLARALPTLNCHYAVFARHEGVACFMLLLEMVGWAWTWNPDQVMSFLVEEVQAASQDLMRDMDIQVLWELESAVLEHHRLLKEAGFAVVAPPPGETADGNSCGVEQERASKGRRYQEAPPPNGRPVKRKQEGPPISLWDFEVAFIQALSQWVVSGAVEVAGQVARMVAAESWQPLGSSQAYAASALELERISE